MVRLPAHPDAARPQSEQVTEQVTEQVGRLLDAIGDDPSAGAELMAHLGLTHRPTFLYAYLRPAIDAGLVEMTIPDKPTSSRQRYRLTVAGAAWKAARNEPRGR